MNKLIILLLVVVSVLGGYYLLTNMPTNTTPVVPTNSNKQETMQKPTNNANNGDEFEGMLAGAVKLGVPMKCTYSDDTGISEVYVKGETVYMDVEQEDYKGSMLLKDDCLWMWENEEKMGMKMCMPKDEDGSNMWEDMENGSYDADTSNLPFDPTDVNVKCSPSVLNTSMFNPPEDVNFSTF